MQPALQLSGDAVQVPAEDARAGIGVAAQQAGPRGRGHARAPAGFRPRVGRDAAVPQERRAHERVRMVSWAERAEAGEGDRWLWLHLGGLGAVWVPFGCRALTLLRWRSAAVCCAASVCAGAVAQRPI